MEPIATAPVVTAIPAASVGATVAEPRQIPPSLGGALVGGRVKAWMDERGVGSIAPNDGTEDVFVHRADLMDGQRLVVGASVMYEAHLDAAQGTRTAKRCFGASLLLPEARPTPDPALSSAGGAHVPGVLVDGTVKIWSEEQGHGVIIPTSGIGGEFVVHRGNVCPGLQLTIGLSVRYEAHWDAETGLNKVVRCLPGLPGVAVPTLLVTTPPLAAAASAVGGVNMDAGMGLLASMGNNLDTTLGTPSVAALPSASVDLVASLAALLSGAGAGFATQLATAAGGGPARVGGASATGGVLLTGKVKRWMDDRGMGFVIPDSGGDDLFIHRNDLLDGAWLVEGQAVVFEDNWDPTKRKRVAKNLRGADGPPPEVRAGGKGCSGIPFGSKGGDAKGKSKDASFPSDNLFTSGLPLGVTEERVSQIFGQYGTVTSVKVLPNNGKLDTAAMVRMSDVSTATWLVENLNGNIPTGCTAPIIVRYANAKPDKGASKGFAPYAW